MTYAVGIRNSNEHIPLPLGKEGKGLRLTVSTTPTTVTLDPDTEIVYIETQSSRVFVEFGPSPTVGNTSNTFRYTVGPGTGRYLATNRAASMAIVTNSGSDDVFVEQY